MCHCYLLGYTTFTDSSNVHSNATCFPRASVCISLCYKTLCTRLNLAINGVADLQVQQSSYIPAARQPPAPQHKSAVRHVSAAAVHAPAAQPAATASTTTESLPRQNTEPQLAAPTDLLARESPKGQTIVNMGSALSLEDAPGTAASPSGVVAAGSNTSDPPADPAVPGAAAVPAAAAVPDAAAVLAAAAVPGAAADPRVNTEPAPASVIFGPLPARAATAQAASHSSEHAVSGIAKGNTNVRLIICSIVRLPT